MPTAAVLVAALNALQQSRGTKMQSHVSVRHILHPHKDPDKTPTHKADGMRCCSHVPCPIVMTGRNRGGSPHPQVGAACRAALSYAPLPPPYSLSMTLAVPLSRPVRRAAMRPTFWPGGASRRTVDACPMCWWLPPPCGCSTGFMATPRTCASAQGSHLISVSARGGHSTLLHGAEGISQGADMAGQSQAKQPSCCPLKLTLQLVKSSFGPRAAFTAQANTTSSVCQGAGRGRFGRMTRACRSPWASCCAWPCTCGRRCRPSAGASPCARRPRPGPPSRGRCWESPACGIRHEAYHVT